MTRRALTGAEALVAGTAVAALSVWYAPAPVAIPAGLLLAFILPGLALVLLMRPGAVGAGSSADAVGSGGSARSTVERVVLVPALSLAVLVIGGLALAACGARLNRETWTALTSTVTLLAAAIAMLRASPSPAPEPLARRRSVPLTARALIPLALILALIGGAGWLSLTTSQAPARAGVTAIAVLPDRATVAADGTAGRSVVIDVTSGEPGRTEFVIRIHGSQPVIDEFSLTLDRRGQWSHRLTLPPGVVAVELYRRGDVEPFRSVSLAGAA
jgi:hypothetical protein